MPRTLLASVSVVLLFAALALGAGERARATDPPLPAPLGTHLTVVALGDSVTSAWGSDDSPGNNWAGSWATGTDPAVDSHVARLNAMRADFGLEPATVVNLAEPGSRISSGNGIDAQAGSVPADADLVLIQNGSADLCASSVTSPSDLSSAADYEQAIRQALDTVAARAPGAKILVGSIPDWYRLWQRLPDKPRTPDTCPLLFSTDPTIANDASRAAVEAAAAAYDDASKQACLALPACRYDDGAVHDVIGQASDADLPGLVSPVDSFHPSLAGQAAIAAATWPVGWFALPIDAAPPTISSAAPEQGVELTAAPGRWTGAPTFAFDWRSCDGLACQSVGSGASYTPGPSDVGRALQVVVTATNTSGGATATSDSTDTVAAPAPPQPVPTTTTTTTTTTATQTTTTTTTTAQSGGGGPSGGGPSGGGPSGGDASGADASATVTTAPAPAPVPTQPEPAPAPPQRALAEPRHATLSVTIGGRLVVRRHGPVALLAGTLRARNAATVTVWVVGRSGHPLALLRRSALGTAVLGGSRTRIVYRPRQGQVAARALLRLPAARLHRGARYRLVVTAVGTGADVSVWRFSFTAR